ncbi:MAG: hypothetical protein ABI231_08670 [Candidatus Tumulicola sp.]
MDSFEKRAVPPAERVEAIWELVLQMPWGTDATVGYIGKSELIANKRAAARPQDLADIAYLGAQR